jgi:hypothetical protein
LKDNINTMNEDRQRTSEAGFDNHLVKPAEIDTLVKLLDGVMAPLLRVAANSCRGSSTTEPVWLPVRRLALSAPGVIGSRDQGPRETDMCKGVLFARLNCAFG